MKSFSLTVLVFFSLIFQLDAQSCCSGGVPVSSNLGLPAGEKGSVQMSLAYDWNVLNTLMEGTERIEDQSRRRTTHSALLELGYSWSSRFSTDLFIPFIRQERKITQSTGFTDFNDAMGLGDAVILFKYQLLNRRMGATNIQIGAGPKLPLGAFDRKDERGIVLSADLQPGSGAWDILFWGLFTQSMSFRPSMSLSVSTTFSAKGENPNFNEIETYAFGNEGIVSVGISDQLLVGKKLLLDPSILLRYRNVAADFRNGSELPSTGGSWLFINPGLVFWPKTNWSLQLNTEIPLYTNVMGTQTTPTYRFNIGSYWRFKK